MTTPRRFASLDALRGCTVAAMLLVNDPGDWGHVYWPLEHAPWNGCTPTDLVFPFFLFVVGVSCALALLPRQEQGVPSGTLMRAAAWRALRIIGLGLLINLLAAWWLPSAHMRIPGVLQRIGLCFAATAAFALYTRPRTQWLAIGGLLLGYWALLLAGGTLAPWDNIVSRTDFAVFGHYVWSIDPASGRGHDPEGLLSTLPALASTLLGLRAGSWLRQGNLRSLQLATLVALLLGALWSHVAAVQQEPVDALVRAVDGRLGWPGPAGLPRADRPARLARARPTLRRQRDRRLRRLGTDADRAARAGLATGDLRPRLRALAHPAGRPVGGIAGLRHCLRRAVVADRLRDGPTPDLPQALTAAALLRPGTNLAAARQDTPAFCAAAAATRCRDNAFVVTPVAYAAESPGQTLMRVWPGNGGRRRRAVYGKPLLLYCALQPTLIWPAEERLVTHVDEVKLSQRPICLAALR